MRVITVARKPLAGTVAQTSLLHGTGGINIDVCRIGLNPGYCYNADRNGTTFHGQVGDRIRQTAEKKGTETIESTKGRWPANLVICHRESCECVGVSEITGIRKDTRPEGDGGREDRTQWRIRPTEQTRRGYADENGVEKVPDWNCAPNCPVADLDRQSGDKTGASAPVKGTEPSEPTDRVYGKYKRIPATIHGDSGGASRFFKQVQRERDGGC